MKHKNFLFISTLILALALQACNLQFVENTQDPNAANLELTAIVQQMLIDQAAQQGIVVEITATPELGNSESAPPTEEVVIPAALLPPAVGDVTVTVSVATNCRQGPSAAFASVYGMPVGQVAKVVAKNSYSGYWIIEIPGQNGQTCWLWGQYATINGDTANLKDVATPTSVATKKPTATNTAIATATSTTAAGAPAVAGCTSSTASNYNPAATVDDGSCVFTGQATILGCTDPNATNYNANANSDDGSCTYPAVTKPNAPTIKDYACNVTGPDSAGNYTYDYDFVWNDNSNNEDFFTVYVPEGSTSTQIGSRIKYPANSTQHFGSFLLPVATSEFITVRVSVHNSAGIASSPTVNLICP